jgi:ammonium transporter, Amt family
MLHKASTFKFVAALTMLMLFLVSVVGFAEEAATSAPPAAAATAAAPAAEPVIDPSGANTGTAADITAKEAGKPTQEEVFAQVGHNKISINFVWTLITGFLVMFMQAGFAMVETGFTRAKNVAHTMAMNFMVYPIGMLGFWICGFAFMFGGVGGVPALGVGTAALNHEVVINLFGKDFGIIGWKGFCLQPSVYDVGIYTMFLFQMVFMDTTATIPTGSMAERWKYMSFMVYGFMISMFLYPLFGNWVWGGGWLSTLGKNFGLGHGHVDFAGSSVVHLVGGVTALAGAIVIGPRIGKFNKDGSANAIPGHHIPMAIVGTFILCFGWFGFNPGSTLAGTDLRIGVVAVNTMLAGAAGGLVSAIVMWWKFGKPDPSMMCNGMLAGLVAITAPCAFVTSLSAVIIGAISGVLVILAVFFVERVLKVDDPVGAVAVHGFNGAWGALAVGLFSDGTYGDGWNGVPGTVKGLFYGDASQLVAQCIGTGTCIVVVFVLSWIMFKVIDKVIGLRVTAEQEIAGLDIPEMGVLGYPDFVHTPSSMGGGGHVAPFVKHK